MHNSELIGPSLLAEMGLALPIMYFQAMQLSDTPSSQYLTFTRVVLGIALQLLHTLTMYLFTMVRFPHAWVWFSFGILYWLGAVSLMVSGLDKAKMQSRQVYNLFKFAMLSLVSAQVSQIDQILYPVALANLYVETFGVLEFFLVLGLVDFVSRLVLGTYFCLNSDLFYQFEYQVNHFMMETVNEFSAI
jgi:putative Mn2+ efflux pump MntP